MPLMMYVYTHILTRCLCTHMHRCRCMCIHIHRHKIWHEGTHTNQHTSVRAQMLKWKYMRIMCCDVYRAATLMGLPTNSRTIQMKKHKRWKTNLHIRAASFLLSITSPGGHNVLQVSSCRKKRIAASETARHWLMRLLIRYMRERLRIVDEIRIQDPTLRTPLEGTNLNGMNTTVKLNGRGKKRVTNH